MATRIGLEPTTPSVTGWCSNQLSYRAMIAQVHRFWRLTAGTCVIIPEKRAVVKHEFQKMSKKFGKVRHSGKNTKTKRTEYSLCACGRGSKSRTHGTRFWRPLLYQLSYTPIYLSHSLNAWLLYKILCGMSSMNFAFFAKSGRQGKLFRKTTLKTGGTSAFHLEGKREIVYYKGYQKCNSGLAMPWQGERHYGR